MDELKPVCLSYPLDKDIVLGAITKEQNNYYNSSITAQTVR